MDRDDHTLKVLLSAYACEPGKGSEPGVGWNVARELSSRVELTVITRANNRNIIASSGEEWTNRVRWIYWDPPACLTFWKKGGRGIQLFYVLWQYGLKAVAEKELAARDYDIIHHITFGKYWIPSRLASLPKPFMFGPVGGGELPPPGLAASSLHGHAGELAKRLAIGLVARLPGTKNLYRSAAWTFAATAQTEQALRALGVTRVGILPQSGIRRSDLPDSTANPLLRRRDPEELVLVSAARLIHWKAIDLAIEAVAVANQTIPVRLIVLQTGPELENLRSLVRRLGVEGRVEFKGRLPQLEDVYDEMARADALVHPALHEAFGQACLESLALGVPVICLNWGGPGLIVDAQSGFAIDPGARPETVAGLARAMVDLATEIETGRSRKDACIQRAFQQFHWKMLADAIIGKYVEIADPER